jgi:protein-S-isoprenylcysteine O-methyltransferase Ste14
MAQTETDRPRGVAQPPLVFLATVVAGLALHSAFPTRVLPRGWPRLALGLPLIGISLTLSAWAHRTMREAGTNVSISEPTTRIVTHGPFRVSRNPLYLASTLGIMGVATVVNTIWIVLLVPIQIAIISLQIKREERYLERKFPEEYPRYKARVRRWL